MGLTSKLMTVAPQRADRGHLFAGVMSLRNCVAAPRLCRTIVNIGVSKFVREILTDGSYQEEVTRIGKEDPDLTSM